MARWRSGNAGVCKTSMRGSDSLTRLKVCLAELDPALQDKTAMRGSDSRPGLKGRSCLSREVGSCSAGQNSYRTGSIPV